MTARQHGILAGIAVDETHVVPCRGHPLHEVDSPFRCVRQVIGCQSKMLHCALEQYRRGQRIHVRCHTLASFRRVLLIIIFIKGAPPEVHAAHRVADERVQSGVESLRIAGTLREIHVLAGQHSLGRHEIGIHTLPTARQRATMVNHQKPVVVRVAQDIFIQLHGLLLVAADKVHLDAAYARIAHPRHLAAAHRGAVHPPARALRRVVPMAVGIIPKVKSHAFRSGIAGQFLYFLITDA